MAAVSFDFTGKRALVTGAGRGIGQAICVALAKAGAQTFALSKTKQHLDELTSEHPSIYPVCVDLSYWEETRKAVENIGPIDLLVNNAGIAILHPFLEITEEAVDKYVLSHTNTLPDIPNQCSSLSRRTVRSAAYKFNTNITRSFEVNVKAIINVSQIVAQGMIARKHPGSIVNISSQASLRALKNHTVYCATKAALDSLTRTMAFELGPHQIRVNSVNPTVVLTDMGRENWSSEDVARPMKSRIPLGRFAEVSEVVEPILFLLSSSSSMVSGTFLTIDGGMTVA